MSGMAAYFLAHGTSDPMVAQHQAIGGVIKPQALIIGFTNAFAVIGVLLALAAIALLFARKVAASGGAGARH
jgi:DHA2 family multidrug resistance protein